MTIFIVKNKTWSRESSKTILNTKTKEYKNILFFKTYIKIPWTTSIKYINFRSCNYYNLCVCLGNKKEEFSFNSNHRKNKIVAYNEEKKILTFEVNGYLNINNKNKKIKLNNALVSVYLYPKKVERIADDLNRTNRDYREPNLPLELKSETHHYIVLKILMAKEYINNRMKRIKEEMEKLENEKQRMLSIIESYEKCLLKSSCNS